MSPDSRKYLWDATEAAQRILRFAVGKTFADYSQDELLRAAIERHFIILGEALSRLRQVDAETADQLPDLPRAVALSAIQRDYLAREAQNRSLGFAGEEFDFRVAPRLFELDGPVDRRCLLDATTYRASFVA